ncbi:MAG: tRNA 2-thiouridine(34) synthase MnmA [Clostridia bacterium]
MIKKVLVGISGGVDSAVTAFLLKQQGYDVTAAFLYMNELSNTALEDAKEVAKDLEINFVVIDATEKFKEIIISNFVSTYLKGNTPNPCIICNPNIKFKFLYDYLIQNNFDYIATGHYSKVNCENNRFFIEKLEDKKDQSYMLYRLTQPQLSKLMLPLGNYKKEEVRNIAKNNNIKVFSKADSQDNCFFNGKYTDYLINKCNVIVKPGDFVLEETNEKIGTHKGIIYYTVGQRKGLGVSYRTPLFVKKIDQKTNTVFLSTDFKKNSDIIELYDVVYQKQEKFIDNQEVYVKTRYSALATKAVIITDNTSLNIRLFEKTSAITPGQSAVIYDDVGNVLGGGIIK